MSRIDDELQKMQQPKPQASTEDMYQKIDETLENKVATRVAKTKSNPPKQEPYDVDKIYQEHPRRIAQEIMNNPSEKGKLKMRIGGRPIDLHALEKFVLFKTDQRTTPTILRYNNAYAALDKAAFRGGAGLFAGGKMNWTIILILILVAAGGLLFLLFGPQLMSMFSGMAKGMM